MRKFLRRRLLLRRSRAGWAGSGLTLLRSGTAGAARGRDAAAGRPAGGRRRAGRRRRDPSRRSCSSTGARSHHDLLCRRRAGQPAERRERHSPGAENHCRGSCAEDEGRCDDRCSENASERRPDRPAASRRDGFRGSPECAFRAPVVGRHRPVPLLPSASSQNNRTLRGQQSPAAEDSNPMCEGRQHDSKLPARWGYGRANGEQRPQPASGPCRGPFEARH